MPAASWPRCWRACSPSAVMAAASGWPKMPNTPHSSRSVSPSRSSCSSMPVPRWSAGSEGVCISSIAPLYGAKRLTARGFIDQLFKAVAGRLIIPIAAGARLRWFGVSLVVLGLILLEFLLDGVLGVVMQERHQPIAGPMQYRPGLGRGDPVRPLLLRHQPGEEQEGDHDDQEAAAEPKQEAQG